MCVVILSGVAIACFIWVFVVLWVFCIVFGPGVFLFGPVWMRGVGGGAEGCVGVC